MTVEGECAFDSVLLDYEKRDSINQAQIANRPLQQKVKSPLMKIGIHPDDIKQWDKILAESPDCSQSQPTPEKGIGL